MMRFALVFAMLAGCAGQVGDPAGGGGGDDDDGPGPGQPDAGTPDSPDADVPPEDFSLDVPLGPVRPVDIMPLDQLGQVVARFPQVSDPWLREVLESPDTMYYDKNSIIPGYQDSYGDNINFPTGMRPNTIDPGLIAVAGGHGFIFEKVGTFHFPFGRPAGIGDDAHVVNFWHVPRDAGAILPVVYWWREPTSWHHRMEWMFPKGTVLGEVMFKVAADGTWYPFEVRTRTRRIDGWTADAFRPFPTAEDLAVALEHKRAERPEWASAADVTALIAKLRDPSTLTPSQLAETHFMGTFATINGAVDQLPGLADPTIFEELLLETPFRSATGAVWKSSGAMHAYASTTSAEFGITPKNYNAGLVAVDDVTCARCHDSAGRPFKEFYPSIMLYGELWGADQVFTWHPFETSSFVDVTTGEVVGFGPPDNRTLRDDFTGAGLVESYSAAQHPATTYKEIPADWKDYIYD